MSVMLTTLTAAMLLLPNAAGATPAASEEIGLTGMAVRRGGFHFQFAIGAGVGTHTSGVHHSVEIGYTFANGMTVAFWHPVIENGTAQRAGEPLRYIGLLTELKVPIYGDLVAKVGFGGAGTHEQGAEPGISAGVGWGYGLDFHLPFFVSHGMTLTIAAQHVHLLAVRYPAVAGRHFFGASVGLGYTFF